MKYSFITYHEFTLPYITLGTGPELMFAFHGFGRSSNDLVVFENLLGKKYTIIAFDLFYHGPHGLSFDQPIPPCDLNIMKGLIEQYLLKDTHEKFSLLGYSYGGKIVLGIIQKMSHQINEVFLLAPDGLKTNFYYNFVSNTLLGSWMMRNLVKNPAPVKKLNNLLRKWNITNAQVHEFVDNKLTEERHRKLLYHTWITFRFYNPSLQVVSHHINTNNINFKMFFGKDDFIIPTSTGIHFQKKLRNKDNLFLFDCSHHLLNHAEEIAKIILE